jgi:hypothetical protein
MAQFHYRISGLSYLDRLELEEAMAKSPAEASSGPDSAAVRFEEKPVPAGSVGEPVTLIAVVGGLALKGLITYMVLRGNTDHFKERIEVEYPDGRRVSHTVDTKLSQERPAVDQVLEKLTALTKIPVAQLTG